MKKGSFFLRYWLPVALWATVIFGLSSWSGEDTPDVTIPLADKAVHLALFAVLSCLLGRALTRTWPKRLLLVVFLAVCLTSLYGLTDELHQIATPDRSSEVTDWVADSVGALAAIPFCLWYRRKLDQGYS